VGVNRSPGRRAVSPSPWPLVFGLAIVAGLAGLLLLLGLVAPPPPALVAPPSTILAGDLSLQIQGTSWITHDDVGGPTPPAVEHGFQMPASMMPGMPEHGTHRLYVEAVLSNIGQSQASYSPGEFTARAPGGGTWHLNQPAAFAPGVLAPGQERSLDLFFDIPESQVATELAWTHDGLTQSIPVDSRPPPPHIHT